MAVSATRSIEKWTTPSATAAAVVDQRACREHETTRLPKLEMLLLSTVAVAREPAASIHATEASSRVEIRRCQPCTPPASLVSHSTASDLLTSRLTTHASVHDKQGARARQAKQKVSHSDFAAAITLAPMTAMALPSS